MQTRYAIDENGNRVLMGLAVGPNGEKKWVQVPPHIAKTLEQEKAEEEPPERVRGFDVEAAVQEAYQKRAETRLAELEREQELQQRGVAAKQRAEQVREMPFLDRFMIRAGREADKLMSGGEQFLTFLDYAAKHYSDDPEGQQAAIDKYLAIQKEQGNKDKMMKEFLEEQGMGELGAVLPYFATGIAAGPAAETIASRLVGGVANTVAATGKASKSMLEKTIEAAERSNIPPLSRLGQETRAGLLTPMQNIGAKFTLRPGYPSPARENALKESLASIALGLTEGGLHFDETASEGAMSSLLGFGIGKAHEQYLSKAPNINSASVNETLEQLVNKEGYRAPPGMRTGNREWQIRESDMRNSDILRGLMYRFDDANAMVKARIAARAMGMPMDKAQHITESSLREHMENLKAEFDTYESMSSGAIPQTQLIMMQRDILNNVPRGQQPAVQRLFDELDKNQVFSGSQYQSMSEKLRNALNTANQQGNREAYNQIRSMWDTLNASMEQGINNAPLNITGADWRSLRERYAMTKLIMNHGMDANHNIDARKLKNHLMANDSDRLLLGQGHAIDDLQLLAKIDEIEKSQEKSGLVRGAFDEEARSHSEKNLLTLPTSLVMKPFKELAGRLYLSGYPATTGLLGLPMTRQFNKMDKSDPARVTRPLNSPAIARAVEQGTDIHTESAERIYEGGKGLLEVGNEKIDEAQEAYEKFLEALGIREPHQIPYRLPD